MAEKTCPNCGFAGTCANCTAADEPTVLLGEVEEDQRTVVLTGRRPRPAPSPQHWGAPPAPPAPTWAPPPPPPAAAARPGVPLADGYPEELTTSLTGSLLGAKAAAPRPVPKTSYRLVIPVLIGSLLLAIVVGMIITTG